jgi:hypothetical protein
MFADLSNVPPGSGNGLFRHRQQFSPALAGKLSGRYIGNVKRHPAGVVRAGLKVRLCQRTTEALFSALEAKPRIFRRDASPKAVTQHRPRWLGHAAVITTSVPDIPKLAPDRHRLDTYRCYRCLTGPSQLSHERRTEGAIHLFELLTRPRAILLVTRLRLDVVARSIAVRAAGLLGHGTPGLLARDPCPALHHGEVNQRPEIWGVE